MMNKMKTPEEMRREKVSEMVGLGVGIAGIVGYAMVRKSLHKKTTGNRRRLTAGRQVFRTIDWLDALNTVKADRIV